MTTPACRRLRWNSLQAKRALSHRPRYECSVTLEDSGLHLFILLLFILLFSQTDKDGNFVLVLNDIDLPAGVGDDELGVRLNLAHDSPENGSFYINEKHFDITEGITSDTDLADIVVPASSGCQVFGTMHDAMADYADRVGGSVPYLVSVVWPAPLHFGTAYAFYGTINIPNGTLRYGTAQHELAHAIRHQADGSLWHWLWDAIRYWYPRFHDCTTLANEGYAFNEGWAEFWAGRCIATGDASGPKDIEGNVAAALRQLQVACGTSDADMWEVLFASPRRIHSFDSFQDELQTMYDCA